MLLKSRKILRGECRKEALRLAVALAMTFMVFAHAAADNGLITQQSKYSVQETMNKLESAQSYVDKALQ